tara:strand:- start:772 stop:1218 length:447 start_codon:yes stop_codon:yes gene_type:complete
MSVRSSGTIGDSPEDRFTRKLKDLEKTEYDISSCKESLKKLQEKKTTLENWVKIKMQKKAEIDSVPKVQVVYNNSMYTLDRSKKYKNKAPTIKQVKNKLVEFFNQCELSDFMALPTEEKASVIYNFLYEDRGFYQKTQFSKKTLIKKQ